MNRIQTFLQKLNSNTQPGIVEYLILFFFIFMTFYYGFASYAIENMNEGLYAQIPREMLLTGNYLVPHLNFVPYLEKPPLLYWLIALSYHLFGVSVFSARLVPVTAAAITVLASFFFGKALKLAKAGWIAAIVLATSVGFILIGRVIIFDMVLTAVFAMSLFCFYLWYEKESRHYLWASYAFLALAFMTKGMLATVLIPAIAVLFMLINKTPWRKFFKLFDIIGILIFLALTLPWVILATIKQPGFAWDFFVNEQIMRFLNKRYPNDYHHGPFYYYVIPLLVIMLPWTTLLPSLFRKEKTKDSKISSLKKFLWIWFLIPFVFFSISQAKAQYYIIIGIPPLALLLGLRINEYFNANKNKPLLFSFIALAVIGVSFLSLICLTLFSAKFASLFPDNWILPNELAKPLLIITIVLILYVIAGVTLSYFYQIPVLQFLLVAGIMIPWIFFYVADKKHIEPERSEIAIGNYILQHDSARPVYLYQDYENFSSILFYNNKRMAIIDSVSKDLYYGSTTPEAKGWFISAKEFISQAKQPVYVVSFSDKLSQFNSAVAPMHFCVVKTSGDVSLLSNLKKECENLQK